MVTEETDLDDETVITNTYLTEYLAVVKPGLQTRGVVGDPLLQLSDLMGRRKLLDRMEQSLLLWKGQTPGSVCRLQS